MKIIMAHNYYRSLSPCGENHSFEQEVAMLRENGHEIITYITHSDDIAGYSAGQKAKLPFTATWSLRTHRAFNRILQQEKPDLAHFQNTFPLISPSAYAACRAHRVPVVQTLRNFRLLCPAAIYFRDGKVCEDCRDRVFKWPAVWHRCYRQSRPASAAVAGMLSFHQLRHTWDRGVDTYIAPSRFLRNKYIEAGFPGERILHKPNFLHPDPGPRFDKEKFVLYAGRLSHEKGLLRLLNAWARLPDIPLVILGDGDEAEAVRQFIRQNPGLNIQYPGKCSAAEVMAWLQRASWCLFPSECYESFGRVIIEAFACGTPVMASDLGAMSELVEEEKTGVKVPPGNPEAWVEMIRTAWAQAEHRDQMGRRAREVFQEQYTMPVNYARLMEIYQSVLAGYSCRVN